ncbi:MAG: hypothetical protein Q9198_000681 [Flavoplaca austrocitrina]
MSNPWITVRKTRKPVRKTEQLPSLTGPAKIPGTTLPPKKLSKVSHGVPKGPPKKASLLGIPAELRLKIWEDCLPSEEIVNLSRPGQLDLRATWKCGDRQRYDPPVLSINRQIYEEASAILYQRNFVIEVNCGPNPYDEGSIRYSKWHGMELPRHFPFYRAKHITLCIDAHILCDQDHIFHHMVYACGLLFLESKSIKSLCVEIWSEDQGGRHIISKCRSWADAGNEGFAKHFGVDPKSYDDERNEDPGTKRLDDRIFFLLQLLALRKRVERVDVVFCSENKPSEKLNITMDYFDALLRGDIRTSSHDTKWIRQEYASIINKRKQHAQRVRQERAEHHKKWMQEAAERYVCLHPGPGEKHQRGIGIKKAYCEGCDRWKDWLMKCRKCEMRVCENCRADLKKKPWSPGKEKRDRDNQYLLQSGR